MINKHLLSACNKNNSPQTPHKPGFKFYMQTGWPDTKVAMTWSDHI